MSNYSHFTIFRKFLINKINSLTRTNIFSNIFYIIVFSLYYISIGNIYFHSIMATVDSNHDCSIR